MADTREMRIFSVEQVTVPTTLPEILKDFSKAVIAKNPTDIIEFSKNYFEQKLQEQRKQIPRETAAPRNDEVELTTNE